jgi:hypothetical protein
MHAAVTQSPNNFRFVRMPMSGAGQAWQMAMNRPNWVARFIGVLLLLLIGLPLAVLFLTALLVFSIGLMGYIVIRRWWQSLRRGSMRENGRENVRVIRRP